MPAAENQKIYPGTPASGLNTSGPIRKYRELVYQPAVQIIDLQAGNFFRIRDPYIIIFMKNLYPDLCILRLCPVRRYKIADIMTAGIAFGISAYIINIDNTTITVSCQK